MGLFFYGTANIAIAAIMDVSAAGVQRTTMSVMSVFSQVLTLPSPIIAGILVTEFGTESSFYYAAVVLLLGALFILVAKTPRPLTAPQT